MYSGRNIEEPGIIANILFLEANARYKKLNCIKLDDKFTLITDCFE